MWARTDCFHTFHDRWGYSRREARGHCGGRSLATLDGYRFAFECGYPGAGTLRSRDGRLWRLDAPRSRLAPRAALRRTCLRSRSLVVDHGRAVVQFANGCGSPPDPPGVYLVSAEGRVLGRALALPRLGRSVAAWTS